MVRFKLDEILKKKDMTMYRLHILTEIRPNTISDIVNNRAKTVSLDTLNNLCEKLELSSIVELMEFESGEQKR